MEKAKKICYIVLAVIFIAAIIITIAKGLNVGLAYGEGTTIKFAVTGEDVEPADVKKLTDEVFPNRKVLIEKLELFNDSCSIKVKDCSDEELQKLAEKINEKYGSELTVDNFYIDRVPNVRLRSLITPYILPIGLSLLLIVAYYAIRYKGTKEMLGLIKYLVIFEGLLYSSLAICRIPYGRLTIPVALTIYILTVIIYTALNENKLKLK
jgi:preprotein translocase subunit SecF